MNAIDLLKLVFADSNLPVVLPPNLGLKLDHWIVSLNAVRKGPVNVAKVGLKDVDTFWVHFEFDVDGTAHVAEAERKLLGGPSTMNLDGQPVQGHIALRKHLVGFPPHLRAEIDFDLVDGTVYRFDATVE